MSLAVVTRLAHLFAAPNAALGGDAPAAVETAALVVVFVGQVFGDQFQAVVAPGH